LAAIAFPVVTHAVDGRLLCDAAATPPPGRKSVSLRRMSTGPRIVSARRLLGRTPTASRTVALAASRVRARTAVEAEVRPDLGLAVGKDEQVEPVSTAPLLGCETPAGRQVTGELRPGRPASTSLLCQQPAATLHRWCFVQRDRARLERTRSCSARGCGSCGTRSQTGLQPAAPGPAS
jgi:hypothetical protein